MKKFTLLFLFLFAGNYILQSQTPWKIQSVTIIPDSVLLGKIQFVNTSTGYISTGDGRILKTIDGGTHWEVIDPVFNDTVFTVSDPDVSMFWSADGLNGWLMNTQGTFKNPSGAVLYKTSDGGTSWDKVFINHKMGVIGVQVQFPSSLVGYASTYNFNANSGELYKSQDGGKTWSLLSLSNKGGFFSFINEKQGWMVSASPANTPPPQYIYHTVDGGTSWTVQFNDTSAGNFTALQFLDSLNGWVVGKGSKIYKTIDGGKTWQKITNTNVPPHSRFSSLYFLNPDTGWIGATDSLSSGNIRHILATVDGGKNWTSQSIPSDGKVFSIFFKDINNGFYTGEGSISGGGYTHVLAKYSSTTAVNQIVIQEKRLKIYPNPNSGSISLSSTSLGNNCSLEIRDLRGKLVYSGKDLDLSSPTPINLSNLTEGIYFIRVTTPNTIVTDKMIIIH